MAVGEGERATHNVNFPRNVRFLAITLCYEIRSLRSRIFLLIENSSCMANPIRSLSAKQGEINHDTPLSSKHANFNILSLAMEIDVMFKRLGRNKVMSIDSTKNR